MFLRLAWVAFFLSVSILSFRASSFSSPFESPAMAADNFPFALASGADAGLREQETTMLSFEKGELLPVCQAVHELLLLKENEALFKERALDEDAFNAPHVQGQFLVPKNNPVIRYPKWVDVPFEDLERVYKEDIYFIINKISKLKAISTEDVIQKIEKADLNRDKRYEEYVVYRVYFATGPQNILFVNGHSARFFSDSFDQYFPFYYKSRLLWGRRPSSKRFFVADLDGPIGKLRERVCTFSVKK